MLTVIFTENRKPEEWNYKTKVLNAKPQNLNNTTAMKVTLTNKKRVDVHKNVIV